MSFQHNEAHSPNIELSPYDLSYFDALESEIGQMQLEIKHIDHFDQERQKKFQKSIQQYKKYLENQRAGLIKNQQHCKVRNEWYAQEIKKSWQIAISNRPLVLRSLARTNVIKKGADEWLARISDDAWDQQGDISGPRGSFAKENTNLQGDSLMEKSDLKGSKLIEKYNDILREYQHKV